MAMEPSTASAAPQTPSTTVNGPSLLATSAASATSSRVALNAELFAQGLRALEQARESRPKNTNKAYDPKQNEWREFCADKGFEDGELVYENKLISFLNERVLDREIRSSRYKSKKRRTTVDGQAIR